MGFELNKLMKQYGVGTASMANYAGAAAPVIPTAPTGERPTGDDDAAKARQAAYDKQLADFNAYSTDKTAFNEAMRKYGLAQKEYDQYQAAYQGRLQNTPMYQDAQYQTRPSAGMTYATREGGIGADKYNQNIRDWVAQNPNATPQAIRAEMDKYGISAYDVAQARGGSMWGNAVLNPTYGMVPASLAGKTQQEKADYYNRLSSIGYTDQDIRNAAEKTFGKIGQTDWNTVSGNTNVGNTTTGTTTGNTTTGGTTTGTTTGNTTTGGGGVVDNTSIIQSTNDLLKNLNIGGDFTNVNLAGGGLNVNGPWVIPGAADTTAGPAVVNNSLPLYQSLTNNSSLADVARAYDQYVGGIGGDTSANQQTAINYLQGLGFTPDAIGQAYNLYTNKQFAHGGAVRNLARKYAVGGEVKTHYQTGGRSQLGYDSPETEADWQARWAAQQVPVEVNAIPLMSEPGPAPMPAAAPSQVDVALNTAAAANAPAEVQPAAPTAPVRAAPPMDARDAGLQALLAKYGPGESIYGPELKAARERANKESEAFTKLLQAAITNPQDAQSSKAEMYFRLAAAFGSPSRTGQFTENLALAGKEMGEYAKGKRESNREKLALQLKAQELRMGAAKEDLSTLRTLAGEEMKDKREMAKQMIKEYIESGKPQSAAGKQALDEGLVPGTPDFQKRVAAISEAKIEQQMAQINALVGNLAVSQASLALRQQQAGKLSPAEVQMKRDTEDSLSAINSAMRDISEAYRLNPNTFDTSAVDTAKRKTLELAGSKDPKLVATRTLENLLKSEMITSAAEKMKGVLSDSDIKLLQSIQGLDAKSVEERGNILRNAYARLKGAQTRQQRRLEDIGSGMYGRVSGE